MGEHTTEQRQQDIQFGNSYRLEYIKHLISVSTGVFVFTVTFMKDFLGKASGTATLRPALIAGWLALVVSVIAGIYHMRYWAWFFISWGRGPGNEEEIAWRKQISKRRRIAEQIQFYGFFIGLACLLSFAIWNLR
jgi:hypothetical protein